MIDEKTTYKSTGEDVMSNLNEAEQKDLPKTAQRFVEIVGDPDMPDRKTVRLYFQTHSGDQVDLLRLSDNAPGRAREIATRWAAMYGAEWKA